MESGAKFRTNGTSLSSILLRELKFTYFGCEFDFSLLMDDFTDVIDDMACKFNAKIVLEGRFII